MTIVQVRSDSSQTQLHISELKALQNHPQHLEWTEILQNTLHFLLGDVGARIARAATPQNFPNLGVFFKLRRVKITRIHLWV